MAKNKPILLEVFDYMKVKKAWWFALISIMLFIVSLFIVFAQTSSVSTFIYALF
jgi:VIT1/CCC1 family predicted Fe2+/Mn2+ transporter